MGEGEEEGERQGLGRRKGKERMLREERKGVEWKE